METYNLLGLQHNKLALWRNKSSASWFSTVKLRKTKHIEVHVTPCSTRGFKPLLQFSGIPLAFLFFSGMTRGIGWTDPVRMRTRNAETAYNERQKTNKIIIVSDYIVWVYGKPIETGPNNFCHKLTNINNNSYALGPSTYDLLLIFVNLLNIRFALYNPLQA